MIFTTGSFYEAARASVAIPAVFTPVKYNDTILVDGGVLNPIPIGHVVRQSEDILVVVNLYGEKKTDAPKAASEEEKGYLNGLVKTLSTLISTGDKHSLGYYSLLSRTSSVMIERNAKLNIEKYQPDLVINIPHNSANTFDFHKAKELILLGENVTKEAIQNSSLINKTK